MPGADLAARIGARVDALGGTWMGRPVMDAGAALGLSGYPWPFYMIGRGGVLGDVNADVVAGAMVFPSPALVRSAWHEGRNLMTPQEGADRFIACAYSWAPAAIGQVAGLDKATDLMEQLVASLDCSQTPLAGGWRKQSVPDGVPERAIAAINVLREHRGAIHAACVLEAGLSAVDAVMATEGEQMANMYGWEGPYPDPEQCRARKAPVEDRTNESVATGYRALSDDELSELAEHLEGIRTP